MDAASIRRSKLMELFGWDEEEYDAVMNARTRPARAVNRVAADFEGKPEGARAQRQNSEECASRDDVTVRP